MNSTARVGRVGEDPREEVGVGVVECGLYWSHRMAGAKTRRVHHARGVDAASVFFGPYEGRHICCI